MKRLARFVWGVFGSIFLAMKAFHLLLVGVLGGLSLGAIRPETHVRVAVTSVPAKGAKDVPVADSLRVDPTNTVFTEIFIAASPEDVWQVLNDWSSMPDWSTVFQGSSEQPLSLGLEFITYVKFSDKGKVKELLHTCTEFEPNYQLGWSGRMSAFGTKDHHIFTLRPTPEGTTHFFQEDGFHGPLKGLMNLLGKGKMRKLYVKFNEQLKARVEALYPRE